MADKKSWYTVKALADGPTEIMIYDEIGLFGVTAADFVTDLAAIDASEVTVRINSPGGAVWDGVAMLNALRGHAATVTTVVDGIAASIASVVAMGGDKVVMNKNSSMMVHNAWNVAVGNADELQAEADRLRAFSTNIASIYADRAGGTVADWQTIMDAETWYTADEAVAAGLADEVIVDTVKMPAYARASLDKFKYAGREAAPAPVILARNQTPLPVEAEGTQGKEPTVAILSASVLTKLGLDADADEAAIEAAVDAALATPEPDPAPVVEPTLEQATQVAARAGLATITTEALEALQASAAQGAQARAQQVRESDERAVDAAIARGAVAPARRDHHLAALAADRDGHTAVLGALASGLVPLAEMGHGQGTEATNADDVLYASLFGAESI
jgi:ATP-dependent protease ClpP protease subunit